MRLTIQDDVKSGAEAIARAKHIKGLWKTLKPPEKIVRPPPVVWPAIKLPVGHITIPRIIKTVGQHFEVSWGEIIGDTRMGRVVTARLMVYVLGFELMNISRQELSRRVNKDHSTVKSGIRKMKMLIDADIQLKASYEMLSDLLTQVG